MEKITKLNSRRWFDSQQMLYGMAAKAINTKNSNDRFWVYCINLYTLALIEKNREFYIANSNSSIAVADGIAVTLLEYFKDWPKRQRLTGYDVLDTLLKLHSKTSQLKCFFFGADMKTLDAIRARLLRDYGESICVNVLAPPFSVNGLFDKDAEYIEIINSAQPDILFISLTQPKQEIWINKNFDALDVPVAACVGAVFDFYAGNKSRAPYIFRLLGVEWIHRIFEEPRKILNRFWYSIPVYIRYIFSR